MGRPLRIGEPAATLLAALCVHENGLPQGAPTSPIIANMICARLDATLMALAKHAGCYYTRYADDLSFSTRSTKFPKEIATYGETRASKDVVLGKRLTDTIESNGFRVNERKTKLLGQHCRQEVTGLTANVRPNIPRRFRSETRALLHWWEKFGEADAERRYQVLKAVRSMPGRTPPKLRDVLMGKLSHIEMVKGAGSRTYQGLLKKFRTLEGLPYTNKPSTQMEIIYAVTWLAEDVEGNPVGCLVYVDGIGFVTCYHVVSPALHGAEMFASHPDNLTKKHPIKVVKHEKAFDLAIVDIGLKPTTSLKLSEAGELKNGHAIRICGYPNYFPSDAIRVTPAVVTQVKIVSTIRRLVPDKIIYKGNSGGAVVDEHGNLVGVVADGSNPGEEHASDWNYIVPISALTTLQNQPAQASP